MKHLNPRQGITTRGRWSEAARQASVCVKHLNPRQGITTQRRNPPLVHPRRSVDGKCETPKSPPGDYNLLFIRSVVTPAAPPESVKHLNPRQGITTLQTEPRRFPPRPRMSLV